MTINVNVDKIEAKPIVNSDLEKIVNFKSENNLESPNMDISYSIKGSKDDNSSSIEKEKRYKETLLKDEIAKGYLIVVIGILTSITLFGIGFIILGVSKIKKAKRKLGSTN